jgi:hypothetical protein
MSKPLSLRVLDRRHDRRETASDRRGFERVGTDLLVNRFLDGHPYMCRMTDISRTGARLVPLLEPKASRPQRYMGIQFQLPGQDAILTASGESISLDDDKGVGVRFSNLPPQAAWAIEAFLKAA